MMDLPNWNAREMPHLPSSKLCAHQRSAVRLSSRSCLAYGVTECPSDLSQLVRIVSPTTWAGTTHDIVHLDFPAEFATHFGLTCFLRPSIDSGRDRQRETARPGAQQS
jgi:hypothetical protein